MTVTTTQVSAEDALRAVADGKQVQMVWANAGEPMFLNLNQKIASVIQSGDAFLLVETEDTEFTEKIACSQQNIAETCENAAEKIRPKKSEAPVKRVRNVRKLDEGKIIALYHAGWSAAKIADEMGVKDKAIYKHLSNLREEGRL